MADGFLGRWSQRKQAVRQGLPIAEPVVEQNSPVAPVKYARDATVLRSKQPLGTPVAGTPTAAADPSQSATVVAPAPTPGVLGGSSDLKTVAACADMTGATGLFD